MEGRSFLNSVIEEDDEEFDNDDDDEVVEVDISALGSSSIECAVEKGEGGHKQAEQDEEDKRFVRVFNECGRETRRPNSEKRRLFENSSLAKGNRSADSIHHPLHDTAGNMLQKIAARHASLKKAPVRSGQDRPNTTGNSRPRQFSRNNSLPNLLPSVKESKEKEFQLLATPNNEMAKSGNDPQCLGSKPERLHAELKSKVTSGDNLLSVPADGSPQAKHLQAKPSVAMIKFMNALNVFGKDFQ